MRSLRYGLFLLLLAAWLGGARAADAEKFFDPNFGDFPEELMAARRAGKQGVLLMFEMENCPYCRRMRQQVLSRDDVQAYFHKNFAIFSIDTLGSQPITDFWGKRTTESAYARSLRIAGTPTLIVFGLDGSELVRLNGAARDVGEFMQFGRYVVEGRYKKQSPEQFYPAASSWKRP